MTSDIIKETRRLGLLAILQKIMQGMTIERACEESNYSVTTFRRMLAEDEGVAKDLIEGQKEIIEGQFNSIVLARQRLISNLLKDAEDSKLSVQNKLTIEERLRVLQSSLGASLGMGSSERIDEAQSYLKGMALRPGHARITQTKITEVEFNTNRKSDEGEVIDGHVVDSPIGKLPVPTTT
jgi:hypothetical protein